VRGLEVRRDGTVVGSDAWGIGVPVDPGVHTIDATAPDRKPWTSSVELAAKPGLVAVTVPLLEPAASVAPTTPVSAAPVAGPPAEATVAPPATDLRTGSTQRTLGVVVAGIGVASVGVGSYFGLAAKSTYDSSNANGHCVKNVCDPQGMTDRSNASSQATAATVLFGVGLAAVAGGAALYFAAPRGLAGVSLAVSPMPASAGGAVSLTGRW
jgi:hypothetical protein